jgi:hypothetical protein
MARHRRRLGTNLSAIRRKGIDVKLFDNPIFITQRRLAHRAGVLAPILISALIGLSLLAGLIAYLADPLNFSDFHSPQEAGKLFYGCTIGVEIVMLVIGGFGKIARTLAEERKAGLWDSNCLTPMKPAQIVSGYWLGSPLREFYMAAILAGTGLVICALARLPLALWPGTQILFFSTALFFGLLASLVGMAFQKPQSGILIIGALFFFCIPSLAFSRFTATNFLLPIYGIANFFSDGNNPDRDWSGWPHIFGFPVPPILLSLALQFVLGIFLWRAAVRKTANPFQPLLLRWEAIAIFALLIVSQHALIWNIWHGEFGAAQKYPSQNNVDSDALPAITHGGTIFLGLLILAFASPLPERVRVEALRAGGGNLQMIFSRSAVSLALALAAVAAVASLTQFISSFSGEGIVWLIAAANLFVFFLMFSLLLEFCRLRFKRRALGFVALWLFVLCVLPFILAGVFSNETFVKLSFLAPGIAAISDFSADLKFLAGVTLAHFGVILLLFLGWRQQWKLLLEKATSSPSS